MTEIECPSFSETVVCEMDSGYKIAHGWTMSTGDGGGFPYTTPAGWKFDTRYSDIGGPNGSHGGCSNCIMTLVHLITVDPVVVDPCEGVVCNDKCFGYDLWSQTCIDGVCVQNTMIEPNSPTCSYVPPSEEEWYDIVVDNSGYILLLIAAGVAVDKMT